MNYIEICKIFLGSDAAATMNLYSKLEEVGPRGVVAMNLFRALKASSRAKVYRGGNGRGSYRAQAYDKKNWSMTNLVRMLIDHGDDVGVPFGWGRDSKAIGFEHVLYVDLPTGQVSFHSDSRGDGLDYLGTWDGVRNASVDRCCRWCSQVLQQEIVAPQLGIGSVEDAAR